MALKKKIKSFPSSFHFNMPEALPIQLHLGRVERVINHNLLVGYMVWLIELNLRVEKP